MVCVTTSLLQGRAGLVIDLKGILFLGGVSLFGLLLCRRGTALLKQELACNPDQPRINRAFGFFAVMLALLAGVALIPESAFRVIDHVLQDIMQVVHFIYTIKNGGP